MAHSTHFSLFIFLTLLYRAITNLRQQIHVGDGCNSMSQVKPQVNVSNNHLDCLQSPTIPRSTSQSYWQRKANWSRFLEHAHLFAPWVIRKLITTGMERLSSIYRIHDHLISNYHLKWSTNNSVRDLIWLSWPQISEKQICTSLSVYTRGKQSTNI